MKNSKSPGSDGITIEFYKMYWPILKKHYVNSINYSFEIGSLTELQKQSTITKTKQRYNQPRQQATN